MDSDVPMMEQLPITHSITHSEINIRNFKPAFAMLDTPKQCENCEKTIQEDEWACFDVTSKTNERFHRDCFQCAYCSEELYAARIYWGVKELKPVYQYQAYNKSLYYCSEVCISTGKPLPCHKCKKDIVLPRVCYKQAGDLNFHPACFTCHFGCPIATLPDIGKGTAPTGGVVVTDGIHKLYCDKHVKEFDKYPPPRAYSPDHFSVGKLLGSGGFSDVYQGKETASGGTVALRTAKKTDLESVQRLKREIDLWHILTREREGSFSSHVLPLLGTYTGITGCLYEVIPLQSNGDLCKYVQNEPNADKVDLLMGVVSGIAWIHQSCIIHGDIKGDNVLVSNEGIPMLTDFGLSRFWGQDTSLGMKDNGARKFRAPEILGPNPEHKTIQTDIYALGITIAQTLGGGSFKEVWKTAEDLLDRGSPEIFNEKVKNPNDPFRPKWPEGDGGIQRYAEAWKAAELSWAHAASQRPTLASILTRLKENKERTEKTAP